jgi:hypothetical protein
LKLTVNGTDYDVDLLARDGETRTVSVNGHPYVVTVRGGRAVVLEDHPAAEGETPPPPAAGPITRR